MQDMSALGPEAVTRVAPGAGCDVDAFVTASAQTIDLPIDPAYRAGVVESFRQLAIAADLIMSFPVADEIDPASVFHP
jgi:hypothetical protein